MTTYANVGRILLKRGNTAQQTTYTGPIGEPTFDTDLNTIRVHDGSTPGGINILATQAQINTLTNSISTITGIDSAFVANINTLLTEVSDLTLSSLTNGNLTATLDTLGTLNTPSKLPVTFTANCDSAHYTGGSLSLTGSAWYFTVSFLLNQDGVVSTQIDNPAWISNPGYTNGNSFAFTEADHGIPGYTFTLVFTAIENLGPAGYGANLAASPPPAYPSTVKSLEAIKLTANTQSWILGTDGNLTLPLGGTIKNFDGTLFGGSGGNANTGNLAFIDNAMYDSSGIQIENADLTHGATSAVIIPTNGASDPLQVNNFYGPVNVTTSINNGATNLWAFGTDGSLTLPGNIIAGDGSAIQFSKNYEIDNTNYHIQGDTISLVANVAFPAVSWNIITNPLVDDHIGNVLYAQNTLTAPYSDFANVGLLQFGGPSGTGTLWWEGGAYYGNNQPYLNSLNLNSTANVVVSTDNSSFNWTFSNLGELTLPNGGHLGPVGKGWTGLDGGNGQPVSLLSYYNSGMYSGCFTITPGNGAQISTYGDGTGQTGQWTFGNDGTLTFFQPVGVDLNWTSDTASGGPGSRHYDSLRINNDHLHGLYITNTMDGTLSSWLFGLDGVLTLPDGATVEPNNGSPLIRSGNNIQFVTDGGSWTWTLDDNGVMTLPSNNFSVNYANGTPVSLAGTYTNANVAAYLPVYGGNISLNNITIPELGPYAIIDGNSAGFNGLPAVLYIASTLPLNTIIHIGDTVYDGNNPTNTSTVVTPGVTANGDGTFNVYYSGFSTNPSSLAFGLGGAWHFATDGILTTPNDIIINGNLSLNNGVIHGGTPTVTDITDTITSIALQPGVMVTFANNVFIYPTRGQATIAGITTTTQANGTWYYEAVQPNAVILYTDNTYTTAVDSTNWAAYTSSDGQITISQDIPGGSVTIDANGYLTQFNQFGYLQLPVGANQEGSQKYSFIQTPLNTDLIINTGNWSGGAYTFGADSHLIMPGDSNALSWITSDNLILQTNGGNNNIQWSFSSDGRLTMPPGWSITDHNGSPLFTNVSQFANDAGYVTSSGTNGAINIGTGVSNIFIPDTNYQALGLINSQGNVYIEAGSTPNVWQFIEDGNLILPQTNTITAAGVPQVGAKITGIEEFNYEQDNGDGTATVQWTSSNTNFVNDVWNPYCVGAPDSIVGWLLIDAGGTISHIVHANNSGLQYSLVTDTYGIGIAPFTIQSPNYAPGIPNPVVIKSNTSTWTFNTTGGTNLPGDLVFNDTTVQTTAFSNVAVATYLANYDGELNFTASPAIISGVGSLSTSTALIENTENSTAPNNGALVVNGGVGIAKDLYVGGSINLINGGTIVTEVFLGNTGQFIGDPVTGFGAFYAGISSGFATLPQLVGQFSENYNGYAQINTQNINRGNQSTSDYVATANNGNDTTFYVDLGIAGNAYNGLNENNSLGTSLFPNDAYLYTQGNSNVTVGGNLIIGTTTDSRAIKFISGGVNTEHIVAQLNHPNTPNSLAVTGGAQISGNVQAANYQFANGVNILSTISSGSVYSNSNVAAYLPGYGGNVSVANVTLGGGAYIGSDPTTSPGTIILQPNTAAASFPAVKIGGAGRIKAPNDSVHMILNASDLTVQVVQKLISGNVSTSTTTGALQVSGGVGITGNIFVGGTITSNVATATSTTPAAGVGYIGMPQNSQSANYTLAIGDAGKHVYVSTSANVTVPANSSVAFPVGTVITIVAGPTTTANILINTDTMYLAGAGTTGTRQIAPYGMASLVKVASTIWYINGTGVS